MWQHPARLVRDQTRFLCWLLTTPDWLVLLVCKATAEGGQRCSAHTREKMDLKSKAVEKAAAAGDMGALRAAQTEWEDAAAEYASTDKGHDHLSAQADAALAEGDYDTSALLSTVVRKGEAMRAANRETAALIKAVRLSQSAVTATTPVPTLTPAPNPGRSETPLVPDLSPAMRAEWASLVREFDEFDGFRSVTARLRHRATEMNASDVRQHLSKMDDVIGSADSDDKALADAINRAGWVHGIRGHYARFERPEHGDEDRETRERRSEAWGSFSNRLSDVAKEQAARALKHPAAGTAAFDKANEVGFYSTDELTRRPEAPLDYVKHAIKAAGVAEHVHPDAWARARDARMDDNGMAVVLAAKDPDSFHRNEAFNQVMMTPLDTISAEDRKWLAANLHEMPGGAENQRILAESLKSWSLGYTDEKERWSLGAQLWNSKVPEVAAIGSQLMGHTGTGLEQTDPKQKKRRWLS